MAAVTTEGADEPQVSVLLVQVEALTADEEIRAELRAKGFAITHQALIYLTVGHARQFVLEISNPDSAIYRAGEPLEQQHVNNSHDAPHTSARSHGGAKPSPRSVPVSPRESTSRASGRKNEHSSNNTNNNNCAIADKAVVTVTKTGEAVADVVRALTAGPVLMLVVEKVHAVAELLELVGLSEQWETAPTTLRARFAKDAHRIALRCSLDARTALQERSFLLKHTQAPRDASFLSESTTNNVITANDSESVPKAADVDLEQLMAFLFPAHVHHPNSTGRLFVFGLYGPLDAKAQLRAGDKGRHVVTDRELNTMSSRMEREDILAVYGMCSLSQEQEEEVLRHVDQLLKSFPRYSRQDIDTLFHNLTRDAAGHLSFHDMQTAILKERCRRVVCMKERLHPALAPPIQKKYQHTLTRARAREQTASASQISRASMFLKDVGLTGAENATLVSRLLSNHAFEICQLSDGNVPALTQNVRLLRDGKRVEHGRATWNPNCGTVVTRK